MTKSLILSTAAACMIAGFFVVAGFAQTDPRGRNHTLHGTIEGINDFAQSIRVNQEKIAGYSDARSATYTIDDPAILKKLAVGDRIVATIYEKDDTLYDIRRMEFYDVPSKVPTPQKPLK